MRFFRRKIAITLVLIVYSLSAKAQCAMCRAVLESEADSTMAEGVNNGIIYLMVIPYILVGAVIWYIYKTLKKAKKEDPSGNVS